jgi:hypothetical protein
MALPHELRAMSPVHVFVKRVLAAVGKLRVVTAVGWVQRIGSFTASGGSAAFGSRHLLDAGGNLLDLSLGFDLVLKDNRKRV